MPPSGNPYDSLAAPAPGNPYDDIVGPPRGAALRAQVGQAALLSPDQEAAKRALARYVGLPGGVADAIPDEIKRMATVQQVAQDAAGAPVLQQRYASPEFAAVAHDDSGPLSKLERAIGNAVRYIMGAAPEGGLPGAVGRAGAAVASGAPTAGAGLYGLAAAPFGLVGADGVESWLLEKQRTSRGVADRLMPDLAPDAGNVERGFYSGLQSLGSNSLMLPLALLPGGANAALAGMSGQVGGQSYAKAREAGVSPVQSAIYGASDAVVEFGTERMALGPLLEGVKAGAPFWKTLLATAAKEVPGEQAATALQDLNEWATLNPDKPFSDYLAARPDAAVQTLVATLVGTGGQVALMQGVQKVADRAAGFDRAAQFAERQQQALVELATLAEATKLRTRDPESFAAFAEEVTQAQVPVLYADARALFQSGVTREEVAALAGADAAARFDEALATGGDLAIPTAEFLTRAPGQPALPAVLDHLRTDANAMSAAEAKTWLESERGQQVQADLQRAAEVAQANDEIRAGFDAVKADVMQQLQGAGRTGNVADAYATLVAARISTRAQQLGMTPAELWEKQRLSVTSRAQAGGRVLEQVTPEQAKGTNVKVEMPTAPEFAEAVLNTAGAEVTSDGLLLDLVRFQKEEQEGAQAVRTGVFYLPKGSPAAKHYKTGKTGYGGTERFEGQTLIRRPLFVKGATGGKAPEAAFVALRGKEAFKALDSAVTRVLIAGGYGGARAGRVEAIEQFLAEYAPEREGYGQEIERVSRQGNTLRYALQELAVAYAVRDAGYDAVVGYSKGKAGAAISEVFDVREQTFPARGMLSQVHEVFFQGPRAFFNPSTNTVALLQGANLSSFLHEAGHYFFENDIALAAESVRQASQGGSLTDGEQRLLADVSALLRWHGLQGTAEEQLRDWYSMDFEQQRALHERTAESFEAYLLSGKAPSVELQRPFEQFRAWLLNVYRSLKDFLAGHPEAGKLDDDVRQVFDRMLASDEAIREAEAARAMGPMFETAARAGMTPEQWAAYQALGDAATQEAIAELQARGLRDLRWLDNARSRRLKEMQQAMSEARRAVRMEARAEVMQRPVYRAWAFLTGKPTPKDADLTPAKERASRAVDPTRDSLLVAIAKLGGISRESAARDLSVHADNFKVDSGVFGNPVFRKEGGRNADDMRESLQELGYLRAFDEHGRTELRELEEAVADELGGQPRYSALYDYERTYAAPEPMPEGLEAGKLDTAELRERYGTKPDAVWRTLSQRRMTSARGVSTDLVAEAFGFTSGDELVQALAAAEPPAQVIEALTDQKMLERHGDLATPEGLQRAVDAALHSDARARMIAAELDALAAAQPKAQDGRGRRTVDVMARAAADVARQVIARQRVRDLRPQQYQVAESRAAREADKAFRAGDTEAAAEAKRRQLIQNATAREALAARAEMEKARDYLRRMLDRPKSVDAGALDQIEALLEKYDLAARSDRQNDRRASLSAWVKSQLAQGNLPQLSESLLSPQEAARYRADLLARDEQGELVYADDEAVAERLAAGIERSEATPWRNLTVEQARGLVDAVKQIEHLGRLKNRLLANRERASYEAVRDELVAGIVQHGGQAKAVPERRTRNDALGRAWQGLVAFGASHIKVSTWARLMDGGQDAGPVWRHFVRPANERASWESTQRAEATEKLTAILGPILKNVPAREMSGRGRYFASIGDSLNWQERLALALNTGNEGNLQRLLDGNGWTQAQIQPVLRSLTAAEWQAVQQVWDFFESYRPQVGALEKRTTGTEPEWVLPMPQQVTTADGQTITVRGGYYPVRYDPRTSARAEAHQTAEEAKALMRAANNAASTRRSFVKARAEEVKGRPLLLNLQGLYSGVNDVIHDLAWREWLMDTGKLLRSDSLQAAIREHWGAEVAGELKRWMEDIAAGPRTTGHMMERLSSLLRQNVSFAAMAYNLMSAVTQVTGYANSAARVGAGNLARAVAAYGAAPRQMTREAMEASEFLRNRTRTRFRELNELRNVVQGQTTAKQVMARYGYWMMMRMQLLVDVPTWWAAHDQAMADGRDEATAVALADQAVKDAQGGGEEVDLTGIERGHPMVKLFTAFYSYMGATLNTAVLTGTAPASHARKAANLLMVLSGPALVTLLIKELLTPGGDDWEDPEKAARKLAAEQLSFLFGLVVFGREFGFLGKQLVGEKAFDYSGPSGLRFIGDVQKLGQQTMQGEFDEAFAKSFVNVLGDVTGIPSVQINRTFVGGPAAIARGDVQGPVDTARALAFGFDKSK